MHEYWCTSLCIWSLSQFRQHLTMSYDVKTVTSTAQLEAYTDIYKTVIFRRIQRIYRQIQRRSKMAGHIQVYSLPMNDVTYTWTPSSVHIIVVKTDCIVWNVIRGESLLWQRTSRSYWLTDVRVAVWCSQSTDGRSDWCFEWVLVCMYKYNSS